MARTVKDRAKDSFDKNDKEKIHQYLDWLRTTIDEYSQSLRRAATLMILLIVAFEIVRESKNAQITLGSFRIYQGSVILQFIPAVVSFLFLQVMTDSTRLNSLQDAFSGMVEEWSPKAEDNDLAISIMPPLPLYWNPTFSGVSDKNQYVSDKIVDLGAGVLVYIVLIGALIFEGQAYYALFHQSSGPTLALWAASLSVTLFCLTIAAIHLWVFNTE